MGKRSGPYRELRRPEALRGGQWNITKGEAWNAERAAEKIVNALRSSFSDTKGIRVHMHLNDTYRSYIGRIDIPKNASAERIAKVIEERTGGEDVILAADQCGRGWNDTDIDGAGYE